jgi:hypothetical protein
VKIGHMATKPTAFDAEFYADSKYVGVYYEENHSF